MNTEPKVKWILIGTSPSDEQMCKLLEKYFYTPGYTVKDGEVIRPNGEPLPHFRITQKKGRLRLEGRTTKP